MKLASMSGSLLLLTLFVSVAPAQDKVEVETTDVLTGLHNPSGVVVQPGTGHVFVSDSGAGNILRMNPASAGKSEAVITDFPMSTYGKGPIYDIGPLGLAFLAGDSKVLVVGGGGKNDGEEILRFYDVPAEGESIKAEKMKYSLGPIAPGEESKSGEGNFYAVAATESAVFVTSNGDDTKGWVARCEVKKNVPSNFKPFIATKVATEVDAPVGIAINRLGHVVVGQMGEISKPADSLLTFYDPKTGKPLMNLETGLNDIAGLAYSPKGRLYAVDFSWIAPDKGALYRLDATEDNKGVKPVKIVDLDKPSALAFAPDGTLYVTVFGSPKEGSKEKPGKLIKIKGNL